MSNVSTIGEDEVFEAVKKLLEAETLRTWRRRYAEFRGVLRGYKRTKFWPQFQPRCFFSQEDVEIEIERIPFEPKNNVTEVDSAVHNARALLNRTLDVQIDSGHLNIVLRQAEDDGWLTQEETALLHLTSELAEALRKLVGALDKEAGKPGGVDA